MIVTGKTQEVLNANRLVQESLCTVNDLKLEKESTDRVIDQLRQKINRVEDEKQSLKMQQVRTDVCVFQGMCSALMCSCSCMKTSLHQEVGEAHSRAEQAYSALRDMSQNMEQLQQQQIKRVGEAKEHHRFEEATREVRHKSCIFVMSCI